MTIDKELSLGTTIVLEADTSQLLYFRGSGSTGRISVEILDTGAYVEIKSTIDDKDWIVDNVEADIFWELIKVDGVTQTTVTTDIESMVFTCPSAISLDTAGSAGSVKVSIRMND